jgi:hypothetical protein
MIETDGSPREVAERIAAQLETMLPAVDARATAARIKAGQTASAT